MCRENKSVIITGATRGIGKSLVYEFANKGYDISFCARSQDECNDLIQEINVMYPNIMIYGMNCDISIETQVDCFIEFVKLNMKRVDVLINNAGIGIFGEYEELSLTDWEKMLAVNVLGPVMVSKRVAQRFFEDKKKGFICNIGSSSVETYVPGNIGYATSKASLKMFSEYLFNEYRKKGIRVSFFSLGSVDTGFSKRFSSNSEWKLRSNDIADAIVSLVECMNRTENLCMSNIELRTMTPIEIKTDKE